MTSDKPSNASERRATTIAHAIREDDLSRTTLWRLVKTGQIKSTKIGRRRLLLISSLEDLVNSNASST
jgi:Helix-turn-helix domain